MSKYTVTRPHARDAAHDEVAGAFLGLGCSVTDTSAFGDGFPDLVVGLVGLNLLVEVKDRARGLLTPAQERFHAGWRGRIHTVTSAADAHALVLRVRAAVKKAGATTPA